MASDPLVTAQPTYKATVEIEWTGGYEKGRQLIDMHLDVLAGTFVNLTPPMDSAITATFSEVVRGD